LEGRAGITSERRAHEAPPKLPIGQPDATFRIHFYVQFQGIG
jgi:hypothetical protein